MLDSVDQLPRREDPPGVAEQSFPGPSAKVDLRTDFELVEVRKIGPCLDKPEGLNTEQRNEEETGSPEREKRPDFEP